MYEAMESAEDAAREIADIYARASRELNYQMSLVYERYRDKFNLSDEEARKLLNSMKDPSDIEELKKKLEGLKGPEAQEILKELESPAYRARIERLQNLQRELDGKMKTVYEQEKKVATDHYIDQYSDSYYREIYDLKSRTGMDFSFSAVDDKELNRILRTNWSGANYSTRIWGNTQELARDLKTQIALAYLTGKSEREIAKELAQKYATGAANARRLVRTESAYISGQAQAAADEEAGIDRYRILATLDLRTSDKCREMDGKEFDYDDMQVGVNFPPFHPYCRTTVLSVLDDQNLAELARRSRDPVTGEPKKFPGNITYEQWYNQEIKNNPKALAAEKMIKNRYQDQKQLERYQSILGTSGDTKNLANFQELKYNNAEEFKKLQRNFRTFKSIMAKPWSDEFKEKAKKTYKRFRKKNIEMSDHALARFLSRQEQKGFKPFTLEEIVAQHEKPINYIQKDGRLVRFYDERALIYSEDTGELVSIVNRKNPKSDWSEYSE